MRYAALVTETVSIPGDERSRTHPGHGYPEHTESYLRMVEFKDKAEMEAWVKRETGKPFTRANFRLIQYEELTYETTVSVRIGEKP